MWAATYWAPTYWPSTYWPGNPPSSSPGTGDDSSTLLLLFRRIWRGQPYQRPVR